MGAEVVVDKVKEIATLTDIMQMFVDKLKVLPQNLENHALKLLMVLTILDITYQVFNVEEIDWTKWLTRKIMRVGLLMWIIKEWDWLLREIATGFIRIGEIGFGGNIKNCVYIDNPSKLISKANDIGDTILKATSMVSPRTWANLILWAFLMVGFFFIAFSIIIIWIEFYMLTGIGIMFIPFGTLKVGENYFLNVCKLVVGSGIKLCVLNTMILLIEPIIEKITVTKGLGTGGFCYVITVVMILAYMTLKIPDMAAAFLSGTPGMNAAAAISTGMAAVGLTLGGLKTAINTVNAGKGGVLGAKKGAETGSSIGGKVGGAVGSLFGAGGAKVGAKIGSAVGGTVGAGLYGTYSAAQLGKNFNKNDNNSGAKNSVKNAADKATEEASKTATNTGSSNDTGTSKSSETTASSSTDTGTPSSVETTASPSTDTGTTTSPEITTEPSIDTGSEANRKPFLNGEELNETKG